MIDLRGVSNGDVEGTGQSNELDGVHLPKVARVLRLRHTEHVAKRGLVEEDGTTPLEHQRGHNFYIDVENVFALVSCQLDQVVNYFASKRTLLRMVGSGREIVAPLDQHSGQVTQEIVEAEPSRIPLNDELADWREPVLRERLKHLAVVH